MTPAPTTRPPRPGAEGGLTSAEVEARHLRGQGNRVPAVSSRSTGSILAANILTRFNILLALLLVTILVIGPIQDALFGLVLIVNTPIGIVQELRAKRTLDRLALVTAPTSHVVRDATAREVPVADLVLGDVLDLRTGDQVPVDGEVIEARGLELDESLVTGESAPVEKHVQDVLLSGSFVVAGAGLARTTRVGADAFGNALALEARHFVPVRSEVRRGIDRFLLIIAILIGPFGLALVVSQVHASETAVEAVRSSVAGLVTMIPEGLVLLTSVVFAVAAVRFAQRGIVTQELASVEMLARADIVCLDKTGTLTDGRMTVERLIPLGGVGSDLAAAAGGLAAADPHPNATLLAVTAAMPAPPGWTAESVVPFSSARKWSAASFAGRGAWAMGAPEMFAVTPATLRAREMAAELAASGARVVMIGSTASIPEPDSTPEIEAGALIVLRERLRPDAAQIIGYYAEQGVTVKVISGDHPATVAALAAAVGLPGADRLVAGGDLPAGGTELADVAEGRSVFGRVSPQQKRDLVRALQARGHVVAMTGDGVNDVLALRAADVGIAMGSGSAASRAVGRLTLLHDSFSSVPFAIREGRRVIANLERVAAFFLTKTVYAMVLALAVALRVTPYPLLPRQLSLIGLLAIGIPAFVLSFAPNAERARPGFVSRTLAFAVPAGLVAGIASYAAFEVALSAGGSIDDPRTAATVVLLGVGLWIVGRVASPLQPWKLGLIAAMAAGSVLAFTLPVGRLVYGLHLLDAPLWLACGAFIVIAIAALEVALRLSAPITRSITSRLGRRRGPIVASQPR